MKRGQRFSVWIVAAVCVCLPADGKSRKTFNQELHEAFRTRGIESEFIRYQHYVTSLFDERKNGLSEEKNGKCRLSWLDAILENPELAVVQADELSRSLFGSCLKGGPLFRTIGQKLDAPEFPSTPVFPRQKYASALDRVVQIASISNKYMEQAFQNVSAVERDELRSMLLAEFAGEADHVFHLNDRSQGPQLVNLIEKIDRTSMMEAGETLFSLSDSKLLRELSRIRADAPIDSMHGIEGSILRRVDTPQGILIVGGAGSNRYSLDDLQNVFAVIDVDGNDTYLEGSTTSHRPMMIVIDLSGDDVYRGSKPGIEGGAILGLSLIVDQKGNDRYEAQNIAQGSGMAGIGILIDSSGNDTYRGDRRVQGSGMAGLGLIIDRDGSDRYHAALLSQGFGGPYGLGLMTDLSGKDEYYAGGKYIDPYEDSPGFASWSQGVGAGIRGVAEGGLGILLDGSGDDLYESDYFSHGGGYWFATGIARDFAGNDRRIGATRTTFDGKPRSERYLRWGYAFGCHYASGFLFDDSGNDTYAGDYAVIAFAWDVAFAGLFDFKGSDRYSSKGSGVAQSRHVSFAVLYDGMGKDEYKGTGLGTAEAQSETHIVRGYGHSFALFADEDREDSYPPGLRNRAELERGWAGGIFVDR